MDKQLILIPIAPVIFLTLIVAVHMRYFAVKKAVKSRDVKFGYFKVYRGNVPDYLLAARHHYKNMFELPLIFYVICILVYISDNLDSFDLWLAWGFVITKYVHSIIRMTTNYVPHRGIIFSISFLIVIVQYFYFFSKIII